MQYDKLKEIKAKLAEINIPNTAKELEVGEMTLKDIIEELCNAEYSYAPAHLSRQRAGAVAIRAMKLYEEGKAEPASDHAPIYLRKSQAERELEAKGKKLEE
mgnify:CR=1 FL=1